MTSTVSFLMDQSASLKLLLYNTAKREDVLQVVAAMYLLSPAVPMSKVSPGFNSWCNCRKQPILTDDCPATAQCLCLLPPLKVPTAEADQSSEKNVRPHRDKTQTEYTSSPLGFAG